MRHQFYQRWIAMVAERSLSERDMLINRGRQVFTGVSTETMRKDVGELVLSGVNQTKTAPTVITEDFIAEMVRTPEGALRFLVYKNDGTHELQDNVVIPGGLNHVVPAVLSLGDSLSLPSGIADYIDTATLRRDIAVFINKYVKIDAADVTLATEYALYTWVSDKIPLAPYLHAVGDFEAGKSRLLDVLGAIVHRGLLAAGSLTAAVLYRALDLAKVTLIVDEVGYDKNDPQWKEILRVLLVGSQKRRPILRTNMDAKGVIQAFDPFGPKVLSTRKPFDDPALNSRCLDFTMKPDSNLVAIPLILMPVFEEEAQALQNKLLKWRFDNVRSVVIDPLQRFANISSPRVTQTAIAILAKCDDEEVRQHILMRLAKKSIDVKEARSESFEGRVAAAMLKLWKDGKPIPLQDIANALNMGRPEKDHVTSQTISETVVGVFNLKKKRWGVGKVVTLTDEQADGLRALYGVQQHLARTPVARATPAVAATPLRLVKRTPV
jgi:hypothetical protein